VFGVLYFCKEKKMAAKVKHLHNSQLRGLAGGTSRIAKDAARELARRAEQREQIRKEANCRGHVWTRHMRPAYPGMRGIEVQGSRVRCESCDTHRNLHIGCCDDPRIEEIVPEGDDFLCSCRSCGEISIATLSKREMRPASRKRWHSTTRTYQRRDRHS